MPFGIDRSPAASGSGEEAEAIAGARAFSPNSFTGFAFNKLGINEWGPNSPFVDGNVEGGGILGNGNTGIDRLSLNVATAPSTGVYFAQYRAKWPLITGIPADGSIGFTDAAFQNFIAMRLRWDWSLTNAQLSVARAGVVAAPRPTTWVVDTAWHTFGIGRDAAGALRVLVDGANVISLPYPADAPIAPLFLAVFCNTAEQPTVAWNAYAYVAP